MRRRHKLRLKEALLGRSRGGLTSKIHLAADRRCRPLALVLTVGQAGDSPQFVPVLAKVRIRLPVGRPRTKPGAVAADKAYSSHGNRAYLRKRGIKAVIPEKRDQAANRKKKGTQGGRPVSHDADLYKGTEHRRTPDQQAEGLARHRHPLRQDPGQLPRRLHLRAAMIWIDDLIKTTE
ncbi:transposase [Streptomyces kaempferi]